MPEPVSKPYGTLKCEAATEAYGTGNIHFSGTTHNATTDNNASTVFDGVVQPNGNIDSGYFTELDSADKAVYSLDVSDTNTPAPANAYPPNKALSNSELAKMRLAPAGKACNMLGKGFAPNG